VRNAGEIMGKKRGNVLTYWTLMELILITVVILAITGYIASVRSDSMFEKHFLARDLGLITGTLSSMPGEVIYSYRTADTSIFDYTWGPKMKISDAGTTTVAQYPFYFNNFLSNELKPLKAPEQIVFRKTQTALHNSDKVLIQETPDCPDIEVERLVNIIIDSEPDAKSVADNLYARLKTIPGIVPSLIQGTITQRLAAISVDTDAVITVYRGQKDTIKIYTSQNNAERSKNMGCRIREGFRAQFPEASIVMVQHDNQIINKNTAGIGIKVDYGLEDSNKAGQIIASAVREYNGQAS